MASTLIDLVDKKLSSSKVNGANNEATFDVMYPTGFLHIDAANGTTIFVEGNGKSFQYNSTGIVDGSTNTIIGRSGSGKSTLMYQIVGYMAKCNPNSTIYCDDIEGSLPEARKFFLLDMTEEEYKQKVKYRNEGITTENVYERIRSIYETKIQNRKEFTYDTGLFDIVGNRIKKFIPTFYLIDSLAMLLPESIEDDDTLGTNMSGGQIAKQNSMLMKKISQLCKSVNIIMISINHITKNIQTGYIPKQSQVAGLDTDERLPGGGTAIYLANNIFRVDDGAKLTADKDYGIDGSIVKFTIIKSRTNASRRTIPLIFNKTEGKFDPLLSYFHMLKSEGLVSGAGQKMFFDGAPEVTFSARTFKKVYEESPELQAAFAQVLFNHISKFLSVTKPAPSSTFSQSPASSPASLYRES